MALAPAFCLATQLPRVLSMDLLVTLNGTFSMEDYTQLLGYWYEVRYRVDRERVVLFLSLWADFEGLNPTVSRVSERRVKMLPIAL